MIYFYFWLTFDQHLRNIANIENFTINKVKKNYVIQNYSNFASKLSKQRFFYESIFMHFLTTRINEKNTKVSRRQKQNMNSERCSLSFQLFHSIGRINFYIFIIDNIVRTNPISKRGVALGVGVRGGWGAPFPDMAVLKWMRRFCSKRLDRKNGGLHSDGGQLKKFSDW